MKNEGDDDQDETSWEYFVRERGYCTSGEKKGEEKGVSFASMKYAND